mgnify:CR=1 FL=1
MVVLLRRGRKPLRFRGRLACRDRFVDPAIGECEIALWMRQDRRMAVSVRRGRPEDPEADAVVVPDIDAAFGWIEALCTDTGRTDPPPEGASPDEVLAFLEHRLEERTWRDRLGLMAEEVLARWQRSVT